jgi:hypothetical protein
MAVMLFTNTYITRHLMPLFQAEEGAPALDLQSIRRDLYQLLEQPGARADFDAYRELLHPGDKNHPARDKKEPVVSEQPIAAEPAVPVAATPAPEAAPSGGENPQGRRRRRGGGLLGFLQRHR